MKIEVSYLQVGIPKVSLSRMVDPGELDTVSRAGARIRINRIRLGNFGDCTPIKNAPGLHELRIHLESTGYRIYFGKMKDIVVIILCAGNKKSQEKDIKKARILATL